MPMVRKQIQFTRRLAAALRREASRRKTSESAVVREAVDRLVGARASDRDKSWDRVLALAGKFHSGLHDVSERHDEYYADALYEELQEKRPK